MAPLLLHLLAGDPELGGIGLPAVGVGSGWALVAVGFWMFLSGRLYSRKQVEDTIHDRDEWRAESRIKDAQLAEKDRHIGEMEEGFNALHLLIRSIQRGPTDGSGSS